MRLLLAYFTRVLVPRMKWPGNGVDEGRISRPCTAFSSSQSRLKPRSDALALLGLYHVTSNHVKALFISSQDLKWRVDLVGKKSQNRVCVTLKLLSPYFWTSLLLMEPLLEQEKQHWWELWTCPFFGLYACQQEIYVMCPFPLSSLYPCYVSLPKVGSCVTLETCNFSSEHSTWSGQMCVQGYALLDPSSLCSSPLEKSRLNKQRKVTTTIIVTKSSLWKRRARLDITTYVGTEQKILLKKAITVGLQGLRTVYSYLYLPKLRSWKQVVPALFVGYLLYLHLGMMKKELHRLRFLALLTSFVQKSFSLTFSEVASWCPGGIFLFNSLKNKDPKLSLRL